MNKIAFILIAYLTLVDSIKSRDRLANDWLKFKQAYNKVYSDRKTELFRNHIWEQNLKYIIKHNEEADLGKHSFRLEMNEFGDMTPKEFAQKMFVKPSQTKSNTDSIRQDSYDQVIPDSVDWRNCTLSVRDQGQCDATYAFTSAESLAGIKCVKTKGKLTELSVQQLFDCSGQDCQFGSLETTYQYIMNAKGIDSEESYPCKGQPGECKFKPEDAVLTINGYRNIISGNETDLTLALATAGPIPTGFNAGLPSFQFYRSGIYYEPQCEPIVDHLFLLTGYGSLGKNRDYYTAKNSWGTSWGMQGYVNVARNMNNNCGVATYASYGLVN